MVGHGGVQTDMVLEKEPRMEKKLHLDLRRQEVNYLPSLSIEDLKAHLDSDIIPPTCPHFIIVSLFLGII